VKERTVTGILTFGDPSHEPIELRTERLLLRPFDFADVDDVLGYEREPVMARYQPPGPPFSREDAVTMVRRRIRQRPSWAIVASTTEHARRPVVGHVRCSVWAGTQTAELGYAVAPQFWGQGLATEAVRRVVDHAFALLGLHKLVGSLVALNVGSARVLEKLGFQLEGRSREQVPIRDGTIVDTLHYGLLRAEWEAAR
jgi:ribosomal-protein-alanine N-acetyltransferase